MVVSRQAPNFSCWAAVNSGSGAGVSGSTHRRTPSSVLTVGVGVGVGVHGAEGVGLEPMVSSRTAGDAVSTPWWGVSAHPASVSRSSAEAMIFFTGNSRGAEGCGPIIPQNPQGP